MGLLETVLFYLVIGVAVAAGVYLNATRLPPLACAWQTASAVLFWPLYLPILLTSERPATALPGLTTNRATAGTQPDSLALAIAQVEAELQTALTGLSGWAEDVLTKERTRIDELRSAWRAQAQRIRDIDALLAALSDEQNTDTSAAPANDRASRSAAARQRNFAQLATVRARAYEELTSTLAWVRELVSMIHLARFTGAPASRAEELVAQIAAAVAGVSSAQSTVADDLLAHC